MNDSQRNVLVTGGSTGIGLAVARRFGQAGDRVMITGRTSSTLEQARSELLDEGAVVLAEPASVSNLDDVRRVVHRTVQEFGSIDVLVNNAGVGPEAPVLETTETAWDEINDTNLKGAFLMTWEAGRTMVDARRGGVILFTSSINAIAPEPPAVVYSASKAAVDVIVKGLAVELAPHSIRVCGVNPGYIETPMLQKVYGDDETYETWVHDRQQAVPMRRLGYPSEVAEAFYFLASDEASYITGTNLVVDGGRIAAS
jgi:NAD(P)-dependent dehydrogenase (short-subunit alcohol dehydrogenase family)